MLEELEKAIKQLKNNKAPGAGGLTAELFKQGGIELKNLMLKLIDKGEWRIRTNQELYQLYDEKDIVKFCKLSRLRWAGHVMRQDDDDLARRVLLSEPGGKRPRGRPRLCWEDGVKEAVAKLGCRNWTVAA